MVTPEIMRALANAKDADELDALLQSLYDTDAITKEEAFSLWTELLPHVKSLDDYLNDPDIKDYLAGYTSLSEKSDPTSLARLIANLLTGGIIPDEETAGAIYNRIPGIKVDPMSLDPAGDQAVLDQRASMLIREGVSQNAVAQGKATKAQETAEAEYQQQLAYSRGKTPEQQAATFGAIQQSLLDAQEAKERALIEAPLIQSRKDRYLPGLWNYLYQSSQSGAITYEQAKSQYEQESSFIDKGYNLESLPNFASLQGMGWIQTKEEKMSKEAGWEALQVNLAERSRARQVEARALEKQDLFAGSEEAGLGQLIDEYRRRNAFLAREAERPAIPRASDVAEEFLGTIGSPRFREFIRSKLGGIAEQTAGARAEWWNRKQPVQPMAEPAERPVPTFESLLSGARADVRERGDILRQAQLGTSTAFLPGGVQAQEYWTGQLPYATEQKGLSETRLADLLELGQEGYFAQERAKIPGERRALEMKPTTEEDPFLTEIKKRYGDRLGFMAEWLGKSPEERGYQKSRFAPRVQFRGF